MATRRKRVNSASRSHRATIARQRAARRKRATFGRLKTSFRTRSGKVVRNPATFSAANRVQVEGWDGRRYFTTARRASRMIRSGEIPYQFIGTRRRR